MSRLRKHAAVLIAVAIAIAVLLMVWSRKVAATEASVGARPVADEIRAGFPPDVPR